MRRNQTCNVQNATKPGAGTFIPLELQTSIQAPATSTADGRKRDAKRKVQPATGSPFTAGAKKKKAGT